MSYATALRCRECHRQYELKPIHFCEFCFGPLEVAYDYKAIKRAISRKKISSGPNSMWRYRDLLPVGAGEVVDINAGYTPFIKAERLGKELGLNELYVKNDCVNPTYSFKDRVVSVAATVAMEFGFKAMACASTGNLAGSVAAHAAKAGVDAYIFVPADLEQGKMVGAGVYGPTLIAVEGSYDDVNRLCSELSDHYPWAFVNINVRPYYAEGSKTLGFEVAEQLGWTTPKWAVVPMASGSLFTKIWKGLNELKEVGLISSVETRMAGIQALGCSPIATAYENGSTVIRPVKPNTIAKSLAIGNPADGFYALKTMEESEGTACAVDDDEIVDGMKLLAQTEGIFAETAGGVVIAGLRRLAASGVIGRNDLTVAFITGCGLKKRLWDTWTRWCISSLPSVPLRRAWPGDGIRAQYPNRLLGGDAQKDDQQTRL
ncbi:MAG: threonine synthase [Dehalococcoidia bacterium]|nr:threonine synthase [Dehalococcoidia bacterium]